MKRNNVFVLLPILLLAACGDDAAPAGEVDDGTAAEGEVLGGTISDEMLPLDRLQSQSPPLREESDGSDGAASGGSAETETAPPAEASEAVSENASEAEGESGPADAED